MWGGGGRTKHQKPTFTMNTLWSMGGECRDEACAEGGGGGGCPWQRNGLLPTALNAFTHTSNPLLPRSSNTKHAQKHAYAYTYPHPHLCGMTNRRLLGMQKRRAQYPSSGHNAPRTAVARAIEASHAAEKNKFRRVLDLTAEVRFRLHKRMRASNSDGAKKC